ncbi:protealysin inhibitor emfourin [Microbacterium sp. RD1]|uniref:protealysin inhibitor emfourin n=1 Tax=Microbacterium sp. RD1 TaxID=3457313 RepID=UPI003FA53F78
MGHREPDAKPSRRPPKKGTGASVAASVVVTVVRSGGIAGMRRQWQAAPDPDEAPRWRAMVESCPWDDPGTDAGGADRFIWSIRADDGDDVAREAEVPDSHLEGPWRTLVDAVRDAAG